MVLPLGDLQRTQIVPYVTYALIAINVAGLPGPAAARGGVHARVRGDTL